MLQVYIHKLVGAVGFEWRIGADIEQTKYKLSNYRSLIIFGHRNTQGQTK